MQEQEHEVALGQTGWRPGLGPFCRGRLSIRGAVEPAPAAGALELLSLYPQLGRVHAETPRGLAGERGGLLRIGDLGEEEGHAGMGGGPSACRAQVFLAQGPLEDELEDALGGTETRLESGRPLGTEEAIRVMPLGQHGDLDREILRLLEGARARDGPAEVPDVHDVREHLLEAAGGLDARGIGVEDADDFLRVAAQEGELGGREGGAEGGYRLGEAVLMGHETVEIAFDDHGAVLLLHPLARHVEGVEHLTLDVQRRLRGIERSRLLGSQTPAAEGHHPALLVADRKEHAATEAVIEAGSVLAAHHQARRHEQLLADALSCHVREKRVPPLGRPAEAEAAGDLEVDTAALEIAAGLGALFGPEGVDVELGGQGHGAAERLELALDLGAALLGQLHSGAIGKDAHGLGKGQAVLAHEEAESITAHPAAEAVEDATLGIDGEGRSLLGMEGAEPFPVLAGLLQVHEAAHELDDVHARADLVEEGRGEAAGHQLCPSMATVAPAPPSWPSPVRWLVTSG